MSGRHCFVAVALWATLAGAQSAAVVPVGTELDVKLAGALDSATSRTDQRFEAATLVDVTIGGVVAIPAGSTVRGFLSSVKNESQVTRQGSLVLAFDELRVGERSSRLRASVVQVFDPKMSEDLTRIGPGALSKNATGGIIGSGKAPLASVLVGAGVIMSAHFGDVKLPPGAVLRIRLDQPIQFR